MLGWPLGGARRWRPVLSCRLLCRFYSTNHSVEHVRVPCASNGEITVSLYNIAKHASTKPLVIVVPPNPHIEGQSDVSLPPWLREYPAAIINYRWNYMNDELDHTPLRWPTPVHDLTFGYSWLSANLGLRAEKNNPAPFRPAYVYGSYLGATLGSSLAFTEAHHPFLHRGEGGMTIRGLMAHNGIYNWPMFLPDHPVHKYKFKPPKQGQFPLFTTEAQTGRYDPEKIDKETAFGFLHSQMPFLFPSPSNLFDPFASPSLFFHNAPLHVPEDFFNPSRFNNLPSNSFSAAIDNFLAETGILAPEDPPSESPPAPPTPSLQSSSLQTLTPQQIDAILAQKTAEAMASKPPRKGYLIFPPRRSTLRLPETLLLFDSDDNSTTADDGSDKKKIPPRNSFKVQAMELAGLMRRNVSMFECQTLAKEGDEEFAVQGARDREAARRVKTTELCSQVEGQNDDDGGEWGLRRNEEAFVTKWLGEAIREDEDWMEDARARS
ncbi:hypothetical protein QBC40DRAFT_172369 [Triangularia verruculosa]|uniref:Uncharacterized protein n=1 Tax=Triangularia verruculosa TaxID=2587418 RepID=A0AAN6XKA3_9PEZI|nr:hypothetical protein QBC40DRAFT_172369 [Triangularia verruculosa]